MCTLNPVCNMMSMALFFSFLLFFFFGWLGWVWLSVCLFVERRFGVGLGYEHLCSYKRDKLLEWYFSRVMGGEGGGEG